MVMVVMVVVDVWGGNTPASAKLPTVAQHANWAGITVLRILPTRVAIVSHSRD